uniref:hypothetical protein n=1 Tax=Mycobacterium tuberculosis TaxID=1773 RepID=UPI00131F30D2
PVEDALGLEEQANLPGTIKEHPNWRRRLPDASARLFASTEVRHRMEQLAKARQEAHGAQEGSADE